MEEKFFDAFLEDHVLEYVFSYGYNEGVNLNEYVNTFKKKYAIQKRILGRKLLESKTGYEHIISVISNACKASFFIKKDELIKENNLTQIGEKTITVYLNEIYSIGLENMSDIASIDLESLNYFFEQLGLIPYKDKRELQKTLKIK